jgi:periplasmic protein CpxP/Spy
MNAASSRINLMKLFRSSSVALSVLLGMAGTAFAQTTATPAAPSATTVPPAATPVVPPAVSTTTPAEVPAAGAAKPAMKSETKPAHRGGGVSAYLAALHDQLQVTPAEEPLWSAFADTMRDTAVVMGKAYSERRAQLPTQTAIQNMDAFIALEQARLDGLKKSSAAFAALYATMSPDQQKLADVTFRTDMPGAPRRRKPAAK